MSPVGFEPTISTSQGSQTYVLDRTEPETGTSTLITMSKTAPQ